MVSAGSQPKFLVTGATGFVARHLLPALIQAYGPTAVTAMVNPERSPTEEQFYQELLKQGVAVIPHDLLALPRGAPKPPQFDVVYHLAACGETENVHGRFEVNSDGTKNLVAWLAPVLPGKRFVYTGTLASVDQNYPTRPASETTPCRPKTPYGRTKLEAEEYLCRCAQEIGFEFTILRLCTIVGRGYRAGGMFSLLPDLLRKNALATRLNWPGRASFLDVADLVRILLAAAQKARMANKIFVCANEELPAFDELLNQIAALHGLKRRRLVLPHWLWQLISRAIWPLVDAPFLPYTWRISCWRVGLMIHDGISADAAKLNAVLGRKYISVADALREAYR